MHLRPKYQYVPYDPKDNDYFGCKTVVHAEWEYIYKRRASQGDAVAGIRQPGVSGRQNHLQGSQRGHTPVHDDYFFKGLSADLYAYRKAHNEFPDQPTSVSFLMKNSLRRTGSWAIRQPTK